MSGNTKTETRQETVLDLDELLGLAPSIKVKWQNRQYELRHIRALDPESLARFMRVRTQLGVTGEASDDAGSFLRMAAAQDEILGIICPELLDVGISFMQKAQVLGYYMDQIGDYLSLGGAKRLPTGEASSPV